MTPEVILERANKAEKLLNDPLLTEAFEMVRQRLLDTIESAPIRDVDAMRESQLMLKLLRGVRANLEQAMKDGKVIIQRLEEKRRLTPVEFSTIYR
jgi:hypothetical protein